jgi:hypothetical protein
MTVGGKKMLISINDGFEGSCGCRIICLLLCFVTGATGSDALANTGKEAILDALMRWAQHDAGEWQCF